MTGFFRCCLFALGALLLFAARPAVAQTPSPLAEWQYSSGIQLERLFEPTVPTYQAEVGLGAQYGPVFDGLGRYNVEPGPVLNFRYKDEFFASTGEGIGANLFSFRHISVGAAISYDVGRQVHSDGKALTGFKNIGPAPEIKFFATTVLTKSFPLTVRIDVRRQLGASNGWIGDLGAYLPGPGSSAKFAYFVGPSVTAADNRYMDAFFGVEQAQTLTTNYRYYKASGGLKSVNFGVSADYFFTPHFLVNASGAYERLLGSAANSPITETKNEAVITLSGLYKF
jgi:outer membrane scaffolding protein for murein synthesis (MipA/OmpV family)